MPLKASSRRASLVLFSGTLLLLLAVGNMVAFLLGGYTPSSCDIGGSCSPVFSPLTFLLTLAVVATYLGVAYLGATRATLALSHAHPAGAQHAHVANLLEGLSLAAGVHPPRLYVIEDPAPNAFAAGTRPSNQVVCVTTGLLERMSRRELEGVLAHELAHLVNKDTRISTFAVLAVAAIATVADLSLRLSFYSSRRNNSRPSELAWVTLAIAGVLMLLALPAGMLLKAGLSRRRETMADATAVELTRNPAGLRQALEKLEADTSVVRATTAATAHLWIESPAERAGTKGVVGRLVDTHPPLARRIEVLRRMEGLDPAARGPVD